MDTSQITMNELGLEYVKRPIVAVRIHRTDGQWLVEYRKKPSWYAPWNYFWWYNDGKYVNYTDASQRAQTLSSQGYYLEIKYKSDQYIVVPYED